MLPLPAFLLYVCTVRMRGVEAEGVHTYCMLITDLRGRELMFHICLFKPKENQKCINNQSFFFPKSPTHSEIDLFQIYMIYSYIFFNLLHAGGPGEKFHPGPMTSLVMLCGVPF